MPDAPKTPHRTIRIPDDEWRDLGRLADATGTDRTTLVRSVIRWLLKRDGAKLPKRLE